MTSQKIQTSTSNVTSTTAVKRAQPDAQVAQSADAAPERDALAREFSSGRLQKRQPIPRLIIGCMVVLAFFMACAIFAGPLAPHDPVENNLRDRLKPPIWAADADPSYILGTDALGRDVLSRLIYGARVSLAIGFIGTLIGLVIGSASGLLSGFIGGLIDEVIMFLVDAYVALPFLIVALTVVSVLGSSLTVLVIVAGFSGWAGYTRLSRGQVLSVREQPYVVAARSIGTPARLIMIRHVLPNIAAPLVVFATFGMTSVILLESSLSFLGLGIQPPTASWGAMLGDGRGYLNTAWWIGIFPGVAIMLLTMSISLMGDWLRDVLDPTLRGA
jgi:peptide/nickel transport system permease protein